MKTGTFLVVILPYPKTNPMIKNYCKIAWRNIRRNSVFSMINILGLSLGMASSLLILLWVREEQRVDNFHVNKKYLYSVYQQQYADNQVLAQYATAGKLASELKRVIPEVQYATADFWNDPMTCKSGDKIIKENGGFADSDFFKMFSYPLIEGNAETALNSPVSLAISNKMAVQFFGRPDVAIGKTIRIEDQKDFKVTAVFADPPDEVSQKFDFVLNWMEAMAENGWMAAWDNAGPSTQIMLKPGSDPNLVESKLRHFLDKYINDPKGNVKYELGIQPFGDGYLHSEFRNGVPSGGRIEYVRIFSLVAFFILFIACINFMNLTTAHSVKRSKEIGVRKVAGALRGGLIKQFLGEAVFVAVLSVVSALVLVYALSPMFGDLTGRAVHVPVSDPVFWLYIAGLVLVTGILAGSYPALYLSSMKPINILKGSKKASNGSGLFRKSLVVFQFVLSIAFIIGAITITRQLSYVENMSLGFDRENLLYVTLDGNLPMRYELFKQRALQVPGVLQFSRTTFQPTYIDNLTSNVDWEGKPPGSDIKFTQVGVGYDFVSTMKLTLLQGREFSKDYPTDSAKYIINESALAVFKYKNPIGMPLTFWNMRGSIIGVVKDFHFMSMHNEIRPLILHLGESDPYGNALVRVAPGRTKEVLAGLEGIVKELNPNFAFTYSFSDEEYRALYKSEQVIGILAKCFAFLAIFIACMGLLGLAMFNMEQRMKEIAVRKVLGASVNGITTLLSMDFIKLVAIAMLIASPIAWWAMNSWLIGYHYRIQITWLTFVLAGGIAIIIALLTISYQSIKAALANPVNSLRSE